MFRKLIFLRFSECEKHGFLQGVAMGSLLMVSIQTINSDAKSIRKNIKNIAQYKPTTRRCRSEFRKLQLASANNLLPSSSSDIVN